MDYIRTVHDMEDERLCFNAVVYHQARIDGEEPLDGEWEWECEQCNAFIEAGNWFGRTWTEITHGEEAGTELLRGVGELQTQQEAAGEKIDGFSDSDDEELDVDESGTHRFNNTMTISDEASDEEAETAIDEIQPHQIVQNFSRPTSMSESHPDETTKRKRPRSPSTASITSIASIEHDEAATAMKTACLAKFDKPSKRRKMPYITTKPLAPAHKRSPSPPTAEEIRSMIPRGGIPVAEFRQRIDHGRGYSTPYMSLIQGVANIDEVEGMLYLKDDPAYPAPQTSSGEDHSSHAPFTSSNKSNLNQTELTSSRQFVL